MKMTRGKIRKVVGRFLILTFCISAVLMAASVGSAAEDVRRAPYLFSVDYVTEGKGFSGSSIYVYENYVLPEGETLTLKGWLATDEGIDRYEYAWVSLPHSAPEWKKADRQEIVPRGDLAPAKIPYPGGHDTAGFSIDIKLQTGTVGGYGDLYIRAVTRDGVACDIAIFPHMKYGTPDTDNGDLRSVSFARLQKTEGALTNASVKKGCLLMTNTSVVALGKMDLSDFEQIRLTYSVSKAYTGGRQAVIGFKSAPEHRYGDGEGLYDLTDHIVALPLKTDVADEVCTAELDMSQVNLKAHDQVYLSTYLENGVTLTVYSIELTYRGQGYDRANAKIYFSSDIVTNFVGKNMVDIKGVQDPVMGEVLRIEVLDETNDPYAHFNASGLLDDHDLRLSADDYKYMVVLARANPENIHSSMTFYLCAGSIVSATEACTYSHTLIKDGKWHYYVFDLTAKENWKDAINGWRFDIINGDCHPGNYVDFASIQFFSSAEEAAVAAKASVTTGITPHALGMPAVEKCDAEADHATGAPAIFEDGEWFEETAEPETEAEVVTQPLETESVTEGLTESADTETPPEAEGCQSVMVAPICVILAFLVCFLLANKFAASRAKSNHFCR